MMKLTGKEREYICVQQKWKVEDDDDIEEETEEDDCRCCRASQFGEKCDERVSGVGGCMGGEYCCSRCFEPEVGMYSEDEYYYCSADCSMKCPPTRNTSTVKL